MSELQNEALEPEQSEPQEIENQDTGAELAPASEDQHESNEQVDNVNQEAIQKVINKKHFEAKEAERKAEEYKQKLDEYEAKQREQQAQTVANIPPMPDAFDDDYEEKVKARDEAILAKAKWDAEQNFYNQQQQYQQQQEQQKKAEVFQGQVNTYAAKAKELNIPNEELQAAINVINAYNPPMDLQNAIIADPEGPLITKHLAANPADIEALNNAVALNPILAGQKFAEIKAKASALKPKTSKAPEPAEQVQGSTVDVDSKRFTHSKGATFS